MDGAWTDWKVMTAYFSKEIHNNYEQYNRYFLFEMKIHFSLFKMRSSRWLNMLPKFCHTRGGRVSLVYFTSQADEKNPLFSADSETTLTVDCQHHSSKNYILDCFE